MLFTIRKQFREKRAVYYYLMKISKTGKAENNKGKPEKTGERQTPEKKAAELLFSEKGKEQSEQAAEYKQREAYNDYPAHCRRTDRYLIEPPYKNMRGGQSESEGEDGSRNIIIPNKSFVAKPDVAQPCGEGHDKSGKKQNIHYYVKQASHIITSKQEQCLSACGKNTALIK